ncbi:MAG TPA: PfkB family carbohydrate kinase [Gemmataceae bacterium]|nr:PfkB family carbohydrate kinase [Gemmataceae bacterium]
MILAAGLSPAWQQVLLLDTFMAGTVNRAREVHWCASGKVLNTARALHALGAPEMALSVTAGSPGDAVRRDFAAQGIQARWIDSGLPTRVCTTLLVRGQPATELVPNAPAVSASELAAFERVYTEEASAAEVTVLIGSLPPGVPTSFYRDLLARTGGRTILDARGPELLEALSTKPFLVKPNREELAGTLNRSLNDDLELFTALEEMNHLGAECVLVTDGPRPGYARLSSGLYRLEAPPVPVINPIGCGDCMTAGIACALFRGSDPVNALRLGLAVATVKVGRLLPGDVDAALVEAMIPKVKVTRL